MRRLLLATTAAMALSSTDAEAAPARRSAAAPTPAAARAFVAEAEAALDRLSEYVSRASWVQATYITDDTNWLSAKANAEATEAAVKYAKGAARFEKTKVDAVTRRKLYLLGQGLVLPAPDKPGASQRMADIQTRLDTLYSTGKFEWKGKVLTLDDMEDLLRTSRDPAEIKAVWEGWRKVAPPMRPLYSELVGLANEGSQELGYKDTGALWRSWYDMDPDAFAALTDRLWGEMRPFYAKLHCYTRMRLNEKYGDAVQPRTGPIRADLLGNMWAQEWGSIYDVVAPKGGAPLGYDLTERLVAGKYDAQRMVKTGENFYVSMGFAPLPQTFWDRSMITRPRDREVICHASAWDIDSKDDVRIKMCTRVNDEDFFTVHHELGHNFYQRAYAGQPYLFRGGANDGFHEAIGDFAGLNALTPTYLQQLGLIETVPGPEADIPLLLRRAMDSIAFLPFGLLVDKWRWQVFSGQTPPEQYNAAWWSLVKEYQGLVPPGPRPADAFDPGAKFHIPNNTPYMRYFLARIYQFQFYRAACRQSGWTGPLNRCSVYGNKEVGAKFEAMLKMGQSRPWPEALEAFTGERQISAQGILEYFRPLDAWLTEQTRGETCGWA
jgi:peptidyl-dipeptidase A